MIVIGQYNKMNSENQQNNKQDDGFLSENDSQHERVSQQQEKDRISDRLRSFADEIKKQIDPGQAIIGNGKKYSLFPDMATGWMPRDSRCHPIPITVDIPMLDSLYQRVCISNRRLFGEVQEQQKSEKTKKMEKLQDNYDQDDESIPIAPQSHLIVCYFGPRYDNTYYAWYQMPFQFPYKNIQPPTNMRFTNRPFNGQHPLINALQPNTLIFDSYFQNGNLDCVLKVGDLEYDLYLRVDSNTRGHFQWYNFKVKNLAKGIKYKFNICNMQKDSSLYERGMKPYILSSKAKQKIDRGWIQDGQNVKYDKKASKSMSYLLSTHSQSSSHNSNQCRVRNYYYKLSFEYSTIYDNDTIQIAYCVPYTFTDLKNYLELRRKKCENKKFYIQNRLCLSLGGLPVPMVTIHEQSAQNTQNMEEIQLNIINSAVQGPAGLNISSPVKTKKKCVVIGCRVHPGQSNSSYMMEGLIDYLCSNKSSAKYLRSKVIFIIVPMLNPDGVCFGNYRTGLSGKDFNREYLKPDVRLFPQVYCFKKLIIDNKKKYGTNFLMFLDFHGHSVRKNVFMYGPENTIMERFYYQSRIFPRLLSKKTEMFRYYSCVFKIQQDKKSTARSVFQQIHDIPLSYTIEASNGSYYNTQILKDFPFTAKMWVEMGTQIGAALSEYVGILTAAQKAKLEKLQKLCKSHNNSPVKQDNNIRTSKLIERKKQKKKGGQKNSDFHYGKVIGFQQQGQNHDDDLLKYIYEEIQQSEQAKKQNESKEVRKFYEQQDRLKQGESDKQGSQNDLQPEKLALLYQSIKRKQLTSNMQKIQNKAQMMQNRQRQKQLNDHFKNHAIRSRAKSSMQNNNQEQFCKKLSQPKKKNHAIVNISLQFQNLNKNQQDQPLQILSARTNKIIETNKRNPKTFQQFVTSYHKWEKCQKDPTRPFSATFKNTIPNNTISISAQFQQKNNSQINKLQLYNQLKKSKSRVTQKEDKQTNDMIKFNRNLKNFQSIEPKQMKHNRLIKRRTFSPTRNKYPQFS